LPEDAGKNAKNFRAPKRPAKQLRILLVEDHKDTQYTLSRLLTHFGH
jgi:response regulator RpfG family c-di-GMP phosphodiesterase